MYSFTHANLLGHKLKEKKPTMAENNAYSNSLNLQNMERTEGKNTFAHQLWQKIFLILFPLKVWP